MKNAIEAVRMKKMGYLMASEKFNVPKSTLERRVKGGNKLAKENTKLLGVGSTVLPHHLEESLKDHILAMEEALFGLTIDDVRRMAYELAEKNGLKHHFKEGKAGYYWLYRFKRKFPELTIRKPESTSLARSRSFNRTNVEGFFDVYIKVLDKTAYSPHRIFNCDEKGVSNVPNAPPKIFGRTGKKQVGSMASAERGTNVTVLLCGNTVGEWVPPLFIFPRKKDNPDYLRGAPVGSTSANQPSGWMTNESFMAWMKHFVKHIGCTKENPALLILDGHVTHVKCLDVLLYARENGLEMISLPPHSTHRMQPLDVTCMGPLEIYYSQVVQTWMRENPGRAVTFHHVAELFEKAYSKVVHSKMLESGFKKCGLWPVDRSVFDGAFVSAHQQHGVVVDDPSQENEEPDQASVDKEADQLQADDQASPSALANTSISTITSTITLPEDIIPLPKVEYAEKKKKNSKRKGKAALVTSSPYVKDLSTQDENKLLKEKLNELRKENKSLQKKLQEKGVPCKVIGDASVIKVGAKKGKGKKKLKVKRKLFSGEPSVSVQQNDDIPRDPVATDQKLAMDLASPTTNIVPGSFVLVKFVVRGKIQYYAGYFTGQIKDQEYEIRFLRRVPSKNPSATKIRFQYPETDDLHTVAGEDIVLVFPHKPTQHANGDVEGRPKSKRVAKSLEFEDERLKNFSPIY